MTHQKIGQLVKARVTEIAIGITPFAVFLVEKAIGFFAYVRVLKRHPTALTDKLPRRTKKRIDLNVEKP